MNILKAASLVATILVSTPAFSQSLTEGGLPNLECTNINFRDSKLQSNGNNPSLLFTDTMPMVSKPELLDKLLGQVDLAKRVRGFRIVGLDEKTDSCRHLKAAPFIFSCSFQHRDIDLVDSNLKTIATVKSAYLSINTALAPWKLGEDHFELNGVLAISVTHPGGQIEHVKIETRNAWFNTGSTNQFSSCKIN
jgi:hypothetical protein